MDKSEDDFRECGFRLLGGFFEKQEIDGIRAIILASHAQWEKENRPAIEKGAVNSAFLTSPKYCPTESGRMALFHFIAMDKIIALAAEFLGSQPYFMNTQLFFNPGRAGRLPYWHRDIQYSSLSEADQKEAIFRDQVLHFRIPLADDPGLDFVPGSHRRWDTDEEGEVRLERNGRKNHHDLPGSIRVPHRPGDLLVFSAHLLHKGVYAGNRLSFDIIFADYRQGADSIKETMHFPTGMMLAGIKNRKVYEPA